MTSPDETSASENTLTPGTDRVPDYHQYLEKASRGDSQRDASLVHSSLTEEGDIPRHNSAPTLHIDPQLEVTAVPTLERLSPILARKEREKRPHKLDVTKDPHQYPGPLALSLLTVGICLSVFLVSLDRTIVATVRASFEPLGTKASELTHFASRPYRASLMIFAPLTMLGGTAAHTSSQLALCSPFTGAYSSISI